MNSIPRQPLNELVQFAHQLASEQVIGSKRNSCYAMRKELSRDIKKLNQISQRYQADLDRKTIFPATGECLVDNMYLLNEQAQFIRKNFPKNFCKKLPNLITGPDRGCKRIYIIILKLLEKTDGRCDPEILKEFLWEYQTVQSLTMGELWAVPLIFRIAIIHKLRVLFEAINQDVLPAKQAHILFKRIVPLLTDISNTVDRSIRLIEQRMDLANPTVLVYLAKYVREYVKSNSLNLWLEARTATHNLSLIQLIEDEQRRQSQNQVSTGQLISSLSRISQTIWEDHFEELSLVDLTMQRDPAGVYPKMDFNSRDILRHTIEKLALRWKISELIIAEQVIKLAENANVNESEPHVKKHVGYYLTDAGHRLLPESLGVDKGLKFHPLTIITHYPSIFYFSSLMVFTGFSIFAMFRFLMGHTGPNWLLPVLILPLLVLSNEWAVRQVHLLLTTILPPRRLLKMDFQKGVPKDHSTMVVIPTMLTNLSAVESLTHKLELYYLANQDPHIYFALLTDLIDVTQEDCSDIDETIQAAIDQVNALNRKYPHPEKTRFFLFHRKQTWNPVEKKWMGWERKRGKLAEFNALLCGENKDPFSHIVGNTELLSTIRYVITLDTDTQLPRDSAKGLIGALAHPLNTPLLDTAQKKVIRGYGLLQPRIAISHASTNRSSFAQIFGGRSGIDVYSGAVSDPYQDLFERGIFTGKGIYDVRVFHQILGKEIPDNMVLSHDLLEGSFLRAGLITDIELVDDYPTTYLNAMERIHRWVRGDWQLLPWLTGRVSNRLGAKSAINLDPICRWQIIDNLRRSLLNPSVLLLIYAGLLNIHRLAMPEWPLLTIIATFILHFILNLSNGLRSGSNLAHHFIKPLFNLLVLPHHTFKIIDAIARTVYRLYISHHNLLQWVTAEETGKRTHNNFFAVLKKMLLGEGLIFVGGALLWIVSGNFFTTVLPMFWLTSPFWVYLISRELRPHYEKVETTEDKEYLRSIAWRTWNFFAETVTAKDHDLPPDNLQVEPPNGLARRTSPTNIGLYLCSVISARDFGYIGLLEIIERIKGTVDTLKKLPRWKGHFYNWYDTATLEPLKPIYVSTVDSGNLVGYLLAVKQGILDCLERPFIDETVLLGLLDIVKWETKEFDQPLSGLRQQIEEEIKNPPTTWSEWYETLHSLQKKAFQSGETTKAITKQIQEFERLLPLLSKTNLSTQAVAACIPIHPLLAEAAVCSINESVLETQEKTKSTASQSISDTGTRILAETTRLIGEIDRLTSEHDFSLLYDHERRLFSIGYNVSNQQLDESFYDLFASEMRQTSFISIALGQVPLQHWFALRRTMTMVEQAPTLVSWSGTMFEYFMPLILLPNYSNTLWDLTYRKVLRGQAAYGRKKKIPWGISESAYSLQDFNHNYQYQAFGVPGLGLKQGLEKDLVVSPYSTVLAAQYGPRSAIKNLKHLEQQQALGIFGYYEAIDFTPERLPKNSSQIVVKTYMAHHQGMILNALANLVFNNRWQKRFMSEPQMEATEPLLRERIPNRALILARPANLVLLPGSVDHLDELRTFYQTDTLLPEARFLSNGRYIVMVSNSGSGLTRWKGLDLTRWVEDPVKDGSGPFYYIRNLNEDKVWSPTFQPCRIGTEDMKMEFSLGKVAFSRTDGNIHTAMQITVDPELDGEIREITLTNHGNDHCLLEVTSFLELALAPHEQFQSHPAFSKLFIETEFLPELDVLLAHRRRDSGQPGPYIAYMMNVDRHSVGALEYETDRSRFIGHGRSMSIPDVVQTGHHLSCTVGMVLDPIFSLRRRISIPGHRRTQVYCITAIADTRDEVLETCKKLRYPFQIRRTFELSITNAQLVLHDLDISPQQANIYQWMASQLTYFNSYRNQRTLTVRRNIKGQSGLWPYGISGDFPIVSVNFNAPAQLELAETIIKALKYWAIHGLTVDLVFICRETDGYNQFKMEELRRLVQTHTNSEAFRKLAAHIFTLSHDQLPEADENLIASVSRIQLDADQGTMIAQLRPVTETMELPPAFPVQSPLTNLHGLTVSKPPEDLVFFNGWGGFTPNGKEYQIYLKANEALPQPWINVIANPHFGFLLSESGSGYTWAENSREFKITPWSNDPLLDPPGEVCYLRDEKDGTLWSATPLPVRDNEPYTIRHGQGYSIVSHHHEEITHEACYWTPLNAPVKIIELTLKNTGQRQRKLAVTYYVEWTLGVEREKTYPYIVTEVDKSSGALLARNTYQDNFSNRYGFLNMWTTAPVEERSWTGNRHEFIGRNGSLSRPAGLERLSLDQQTGAAFNPCGAIQLKIELKPGEEIILNILVGAASSRISAQQYLKQYHRQDTALQARRVITDFWQNTLSQAQVSTPDTGFDFLINHWLLYQTLVCRIWTRSAFYQAGGAYGYRDQLQDVLALLHTKPDLTRSQILLHAAHQFQEGDVQHWWHEESGHGIRTRYSDDLLWLVYAACRYTKHTEDHSIWDETVPFLEDAPLRPDEKERYAPTKESKETASLYLHCIRAIERASVFGAHSLPLMGGGDWNDGMNKVGLEGKGESVWLAWFLYAILNDFIPVCLQQGDQEHIEKYRFMMEQISWAAENSAWDGQWYRRAYNDHGEPLGSVNNSECQIDCIAQAWAVISNAAPADKAKTAMWSLYHELILHDEAILNLLSPPFSQTNPSPGYIQAYPPGIRENGGQYTHGAAWAILAWAKLGNGNLAGELFKMINPIYHTQTPREAQTYRVEPYIMAADVYSSPPHTGKGGWSWYTGSAGWMYQAGLEWILGIQRQGEFLRLRPCIPEEWPEYEVNYKFGKSIYQITVKNPNRKQTGIHHLLLDGEVLDPKKARFPLKDDGKVHQVEAEL